MVNFLSGVDSGGEGGGLRGLQPQINDCLRPCLRGGKKMLDWFTCRNFGQGGYQVKKEKKKNCQPLATECLARHHVSFFLSFFFFLFLVVGPSEHRWVYMVLGSSYLAARKILLLEIS